MVDTYGGRAHHGGGAFSGKDATKVDRSAAYMARYIAKQLVASGKTSECEIELAYSIGLAEPVSLRVNTFGKNTADERNLENFIHHNFPLTPTGIIETLGLRRPLFRKTAFGGHFGRNEFPWEKI